MDLDQSSLRIRASIQGQTFTLAAMDGYPLGATLFAPEGAARGTLIVHGATATPQTFYRRFARYAASQGLRVLTYDYRGIGASRPASLRGLSADLNDWAQLDARAAHRLIEERFPGEPVVVLGHSFGGQLLGLIDEPHAARAALLVGCQLAYYGSWPTRFARARLIFAWRALVPLLTRACGYLPGHLLGLGEDIPARVALQWARFCLHPDYYAGEYPDARRRLARFDRPMLFYSFTDDAFAPPRAVAHLLGMLAAARIDHRRIDPRDHGSGPIGHFGFFRAAHAPQLWPEAIGYLLDAIDGREPRVLERTVAAAEADPAGGRLALST